MDYSMRGDDEIAVLTKHNSCKGLYTGMVRGCLQTLLIIFLVWQEYGWATIPLWLELLSRKSVIENVLNIPFIRSS